MRVGIVCPYDLDLDGGVQQLCQELGARLAEVGDEPILIGPGSTPDAVGRSSMIRANQSTNPVSIQPRAFGRTRRRLPDVDVVHVHEPFIPLVGWAALRTGKPTVATFHADPAPWTRRLYRLAALVGRRLLAGSVVTAVSPVSAGALPASWGEPQLIPNAIDVGSYQRGVPRSPSRVVFLGRDDPRKGLDVLLAAWPAVRETQPEAELVVIGRARPRSIAGVDFRGRVDEEEKRDLLSSAAVMVAPNLGGESFGITVVEAMASGCAVIASNLPAFAHVLDGNGILVPPGDAGYLSRQLSALLADTRRVDTLARQARRAAARFDWSHVIGMYHAAYESAVNGQGMNRR